MPLTKLATRIFPYISIGHVVNDFTFAPVLIIPINSQPQNKIEMCAPEYTP